MITGGSGPSTDGSVTETPELDRLAEFRESGVTSVLGEFFDWLRDQNMSLTRYGDVIDERMCITCKGVGYYTGNNPHPEAGWSSAQPLEITMRCKPCEGEGYNRVVTGQDWFEDMRPPERLIADFLGVDLDLVENERLALLDAQRKLNEQQRVLTNERET